MTTEEQVVEVCVERLNRESGLVFYSDGSWSTITNMIDLEGCETSDPEIAVACVTQHQPSGAWLSIDLSDFDSPVYN